MGQKHHKPGDIRSGGSRAFEDARATYNLRDYATALRRMLVTQAMWFIFQ